jgi:hypothetical protein
MWAVTSGRAALGRTEDGWLTVAARSSAEVTLRARLRWSLLDPWSDLR